VVTLKFRFCCLRIAPNWIGVKRRLPQCVSTMMWTCIARMEVKLHSFITLAWDWVEWSSARSVCYRGSAVTCSSLVQLRRQLFLRNPKKHFEWNENTFFALCFRRKMCTFFFVYPKNVITSYPVSEPNCSFDKNWRTRKSLRVGITTSACSLHCCYHMILSDVGVDKGRNYYILCTRKGGGRCELFSFFLNPSSYPFHVGRARKLCR
jgi:hypothetical protein